MYIHTSTWIEQKSMNESLLAIRSNDLRKPDVMVVDAALKTQLDRGICLCWYLWFIQNMLFLYKGLVAVGIHSETHSVFYFFTSDDADLTTQLWIENTKSCVQHMNKH